MLTLCVLRLIIVQICVMPSCKAVDLQLLRNRVFRLRNVHICACHPGRGSFADAQESRFQAWKRSYMGSAALIGCRFADVQEPRFQVTKHPDMRFAVMKGLRFAETQESCFEAWKRSHVCCVALLCGRFVASEESRFQASKRSNMGSAVL